MTNKSILDITIKGTAVPELNKAVALLKTLSEEDKRKLGVLIQTLKQS